MGVGSLTAKIRPAGESKSSFSSQAPTPPRADSNLEKNDNLTIDDSPVKYLTWRSFILGLCVSMGGFIFGYSTGGCHNQSKLWRYADPDRSNLGFHHHEGFQDAFRRVPPCYR